MILIDYIPCAQKGFDLPITKSKVQVIVLYSFLIKNYQLILTMFLLWCN